MSRMDLNVSCEICGKSFCIGCPDPKDMYTEYGGLSSEGERYAERMEEVKKVIEGVDAVCRMLNHGSYKEVYYGLAQALSREHRTLQQLYMNVLVRGIVDFFAWEKQHTWTDLRNEASCDLAEKLKIIMDDNPLPYI